MNGLTSVLLLILALCRMAYLSTFSVLSSMLKRVQPPFFCKTALDSVFDFNFNDSIISIKSLPFVLSSKSFVQLNRPVRSDAQMNKGLLILLFAILLLPSINAKAASFYMDDGSGFVLDSRDPDNAAIASLPNQIVATGTFAVSPTVMKLPKVMTFKPPPIHGG